MQYAFYIYIFLCSRESTTLTITNMAISKAAMTITTGENRSTAKLDTIRQIEKRMQTLWADLKVFEADAPAHSTKK